MMNIQPSVKLIIFIYQQESLLCCSMSIGYWCNIEWVLFSYMSVDFSHTPPKKQQQQKQKTDGGWSEHWGCKWWEGRSTSSHHGARFCSDREVGDTGDTHRCLPFRAQHRHRQPLSQPWALVAESQKQARNHPCGVGDGESSLIDRCNLHVTIGRTVEVLRTKEAQRASPSYGKHLYEPDLQLP